MRRSWVQLKINGEWTMVPKEESHLYRDESAGGAPYVIPDIQPYKSMQTGEYIGSRSTHRQHLKQHGLIEVGNERLPPRKPVPMDSCVPELREAVREFQRKRGR